MDKAFVLVGHGAGDEALELYNGLLEAVREKEKNGKQYGLGIGADEKTADIKRTDDGDTAYSLMQY